MNLVQKHIKQTAVHIYTKSSSII